MDPDVAQLVREQRLLEAAKLAGERGDARSASALYEQACEWGAAAAEAMRAGDAPRALHLAVYDGDESTAEQALALVVRSAAASEAAASRLAQRGQHAWAARVLEGCGRTIDAARAWERAGEARRAAALLEGAGEPAEAVRVLQTALHRDPQAWGLAVNLGAHLGRLARWEPAARVLQRVPAGTPERCEALVHLVPALEGLGLAHAASDVRAEIESLGGPAKTRPDPPETEPVPGRPARLFGRYDLAREVASSPSARVLECVDVVRGERVAVKMFAAWEALGSGRDALARFEREVRAMRSLEHPSVVPLRDFIPEGPAMVLAWMAGGTLERMLSAQQPIAPARAVEIASALLSALGAAHHLGILHRDVKPANVLFDEAGGARLSDFGVAHLGDLSTTATAGIFGTLGYMSPEQREGRPATVRSDVFAVGVMLREMLTGERANPDEASHRLPSEAHRGLDARHDAAVARMTSRDPNARPIDALAARAELAAVPWPQAADGAAVGPPAPHTPRAPTDANRLEPRPDGTWVDRWTERAVERAPLTERSLARARAFALADHTALQTVWRADEAAGAIWLEALGGARLARPLFSHERVQLEGALGALHAAGAVHGQVDRDHVVVTTAGVVLRFAGDHDATATVDRDRIALAKMFCFEGPKSTQR
jgi:eukaryotic-like serine/threonine-protein kinase